MAYHSFEELEVWQRSAISISSNIAEGSERDSKQDFIRFLRIAKGSAAELRTQGYIARELKITNGADMDHLIKECKEIGAMLQGLIRSIEKH